MLGILIKSGQTAVISNDKVNDQRFSRILEEIRRDEIKQEFEWAARKKDLLDSSLLPVFGKLQTAQSLLQSFVRSYENTDR